MYLSFLSNMLLSYIGMVMSKLLTIIVIGAKDANQSVICCFWFIVKSAALFAWVVISEKEKLCWCVVLIFIRRCGAALLHNCTAPPGPGSCAVWGHGGETAAAESPA